MRKTDKMTNEIQRMQNDADYVIADNFLSNPKFIRKISKTETKTLKEIYTPKLLVEIMSRLKPEHIEGLNRNQTITFELNIKDFLNDINVNEKHGYGYLVESVDMLQTTQLKWIDGKTEYSVPIISKMIHEKGSGKIELYVDVDLAKRILSVKSDENFSFIKHNFYKLQLSQAIRLYQFFKSWSNKGMYKTYPKDGKNGLEVFKEQFGYNTDGYLMYNKFESRVLIPAITEINEKTDIYISFQKEGENLDGKRPRITGLIFYIKVKEKIKQLAEPQQQTAPKPDSQAEKQAIVKPIQNNEPSEAEIIVLGEKLKLSLVQVQTIIGELKGNHIRAFEVLQGCINEGKTKTINSNFAYIITSLSTLGIGLWQEQKEKKQKEELQKIEKQKELKLKILNDEYQKRKEVQFVKIYNDCTEPQKIELLEYIKDMYSGKSHLKMYVENNILTNLGIYMAGQIAAEKLNVGLKVRQNKFREEIYNREKITIDFDLSDKVILSNTLFEPEKPQKAPTATDRQQVATPAPTEPKPTNTLTNAQKAENIKKYNEMKAKTVEAVKMPVDDTPPVLEQVKATPAPAEPQAEVEPVEQSKQEPEPKSILSNLINKFTNW